MKVSEHHQHSSTPFDPRHVETKRSNEDHEQYKLDLFKKVVKITKFKPITDRVRYRQHYIDSVGEMYELSGAGKKVMGYFLDCAVRDGSAVIVTFSIEECMQTCGYGTKNMVYRGMADLLDKDLIARSENSDVYFCQPLVFPMKKTVIIGTQYSLK
ncbi:MAG: hypothetical protein ACTSPB_13240 [Candidatus Thorarchaeota archaeon]